MLIVQTPSTREDSYGSGEFGASRGDRTHNGKDFPVLPDSICLSLTSGIITKIGFPYRYDPKNPEKATYRYVEVTGSDKNRLRYFYISPLVLLGDKVSEGDRLGTVQDLCLCYKGITPHIHFEVKTPKNTYLDPTAYLEDLVQ